MLKFLKHKIRDLAIWLETTTELWVVPARVHKLVDEGKFSEASKILDDAEREWPNDPEITYARSLSKFLEPKVPNDRGVEIQDIQSISLFGPTGLEKLIGEAEALLFDSAMCYDGRSFALGDRPTLDLDTLGRYLSGELKVDRAWADEAADGGSRDLRFAERAIAQKIFDLASEIGFNEIR